MKKVLTILFSAMLCAACAIGVAACAENQEPEGQVWTTEAVYARAQELGYTGTLEEFIAQISGKDGTDGVGIRFTAVRR